MIYQALEIEVKTKNHHKVVVATKHQTQLLKTNFRDNSSDETALTEVEQIKCSRVNQSIQAAVELKHHGVQLELSITNSH